MKKSHRLGYSIPRHDAETQDNPQQPRHLDPITYIHCWAKYNPHERVDITKAKQMTRADLLAADPRGIELLLAYGVTQKQLSEQYQVPLGSITPALKAMGVNTRVPKLIDLVANPELSQGTEHAPSTDSAPVKEPDPALDPEPSLANNQAAAPAPDVDDTPAMDPTQDVGEETIWFFQNGSKKFPNVTVRKTGRIELSSEIGKHFPVGDQVGIGLQRDCTRLKIVKATDGGIRVSSSVKDGQRKTICCSAVAHVLSDKNVELPAKYKMEGAGQEWAGDLSGGASV